jgi:lysozyme family protein
VNVPDSFETAVQFVLNEEGSVGNLKNDTGGLTKWGIASHVYPQVLNEAFTEQDAISIYKKDYWQRCHCDRMPQSIALLVFNCAVNQGQETAIKLLQRSLRVKDDGIIGPQTMNALNKLNTEDIVDEFTSQQLMRYFENKQFADFGLGWTRRAVRAHRESLMLG